MEGPSSGAALHVHLMSGLDQPRHAVRNQRDATLAGSRFNRDPNAHLSSSPKGWRDTLAPQGCCRQLLVITKKWPRDPGPFLPKNLPAELQAELDVARSTSADDRIGCGNVRRVLNLPEAAGNTNIVAHELLLGIFEVRVVEQIEELGAELNACFLRQLPALHN